MWEDNKEMDFFTGGSGLVLWTGILAVMIDLFITNKQLFAS